MVKYEYKYISLEDAKKMESSEWRLVQVVGKTLVFEKVIQINDFVTIPYTGSGTVTLFNSK